MVLITWIERLVNQYYTGHVPKEVKDTEIGADIEQDGGISFWESMPSCVGYQARPSLQSRVQPIFSYTDISPCHNAKHRCSASFLVVFPRLSSLLTFTLLAIFKLSVSHDKPKNSGMSFPFVGNGNQLPLRVNFSQRIFITPLIYSWYCHLYKTTSL